VKWLYGALREMTLVGRFTSVWRLEPDGQWCVVVDKGNDVCDCGAR